MASFVRNITLRGEIKGSASGNPYEATRVMLDDGDPTTAFRIVGFQAWPVNGGSAEDGCMVLATEESGITSYNVTTQHAGDNRQIGWAAWTSSGSSGDRVIGQGIVDPDNIVNEDLWLGGYTSGSGSDMLNYIIIAERIKINLNENLYATIRAKSQSN